MEVDHDVDMKDVPSPVKGKDVVGPTEGGNNVKLKIVNREHSSEDCVHGMVSNTANIIIILLLYIVLIQTVGGAYLCRQTECDRNARVGGYCARHGGGRKCCGEGCTYVARVKGMCAMHNRESILVTKIETESTIISIV